MGNLSPLSPAPPEKWKGHYREVRTDAWTSVIDRDLWSGDGPAPDWLEHPERLLEKDRVVRWFKKGRNRLAEISWPTVEGRHSPEAPATLVLKEYGAADVIARVRSLVRPPRALRGWSRAFSLLKRGVHTPRPLWLVLPSEGRGDRQGYLGVETAPPHTRAREALKQIRGGQEIIDLGEGRTMAGHDFLRYLASYARFLHDAGIWHRDFSGGNILIPHDWRPASDDPPNTAPPFLLIDVNRCRLLEPGTLPFKARLQDLERVSLDSEDLQRVFYAAYATGDSSLEAGLDLYLQRARLYRRLRNTRNPALRLWRKIFDYWLR